MTTSSQLPPDPDSSVILTSLQDRWMWILLTGVLLILAGAAAIGDAALTTIVSAVFFGWVLIVGGIVRTVRAVLDRHKGRMFLHLVIGELSIITGVLLLRRPLGGVATFTVIIALYFLVIGVFRLLTGAAMAGIPGRIWTLLDGALSVGLGVLILTHWPENSMFILALFIGIRLVFAGWTQCAIAIMLRRSSRRNEAPSR